jgi:hypothetical protein
MVEAIWRNLSRTTRRNFLMAYVSSNISPSAQIWLTMVVNRSVKLSIDFDSFKCSPQTPF